MAEWYSAATAPEIDRLRSEWDDAPIEYPESLESILAIAQEQVLRFGPALAEGAPVPDRFVYAQLQQAKNLWAAGAVSRGGGEMGEGEFSYVPRPLDKTIKGIIRPIDGKPDVY